MQPDQAPSGDTSVSRASLVVLVIDAVLIAGLAAAMVYMPARFEKIFKDFDATLPAVTRLLLSVPGYAYAGVLVLGLVLLVLKEALCREASVNLLLNLLALLGLLAFAALMVVALFLPLVTLVENLQ